MTSDEHNKPSRRQFIRRDRELPFATEHQINAKTWEECQDVIQRLEADTRGDDDELLFRGQRDAEWRLETTLERRTGKLRPAFAYFQLMLQVQPAIETFTGMTWELPTLDQLHDITKNYDVFGDALRRLAVYLAHLRHNGFPSPLLD